ncbi:uncharacterized protein LOC135807003 [Sycon ciliatum]|uniref:uncharacterized protein LOC135807003 n=1 Tax=Sycon ciliatum TaxID=27933 RepID=UPI0031F6B3F9
MADSASSSRFVPVSDEEKARLLDEAVPQKTKQATKFWMSVFKDFCSDNEDARKLLQEKDADWMSIEEETLASLLESFYCCARKKDKTEYKRASMIAARGAIQRQLNIFNRGIDLKSLKFDRANKLLDAVLKDKKKNGREAPVTHKETICDADGEKLSGYFADVSTTLDVKKLTQYVWFNCTIHFCLRGNEAQSQLKPSDLVFTTIAGEEAIVLHADYMSKNHQGGLTGSHTETSGAITRSDMIAVFRRYLSKLHPEMDRLFQRAKYGSGVLAMDCDVWFMKSALGHNTLGKMMKEISSAAGLGQTYTNHCVRVTSISHMKASGAEDRKICTVSGHRNVQSLQAYDRPTASDVMALSKAIDKENVSPQTSPAPVSASPVSAPPAAVAAAASSSPSPLGSLFSAQGSTWSNVTINVTPQLPEKRKNRPSLKLKKKPKKEHDDDDK